MSGWPLGRVALARVGICKDGSIQRAGVCNCLSLPLCPCLACCCPADLRRRPPHAAEEVAAASVAATAKGAISDAYTEARYGACVLMSAYAGALHVQCSNKIARMNCVSLRRAACLCIHRVQLGASIGITRIHQAAPGGCNQASEISDQEIFCGRLITPKA